MNKIVTTIKAIVFALTETGLLLYQSFYQQENINLLVIAVFFVLYGEINIARLDRYNK